MRVDAMTTPPWRFHEDRQESLQDVLTSMQLPDILIVFIYLEWPEIRKHGLSSSPGPITLHLPLTQGGRTRLRRGGQDVKVWVSAFKISQTGQPMKITPEHSTAGQQVVEMNGHIPVEAFHMVGRIGPPLVSLYHGCMDLTDAASKHYPEFYAVCAVARRWTSKMSTSAYDFDNWDVKGNSNERQATDVPQTVEASMTPMPRTDRIDLPEMVLELPQCTRNLM